ncbi:FAD-binding protein [Saccharothrix sp. ALI-22-I]|uniref:FAD-binding oxidoreductase n=1 Tax=Saccharothrix sp. ALI-22-I TaxID=1933778 RepID=UPI00097C22D6|nr:FAD-binding oxidoreductase [Saccharothrix sp. ALI-22-I]ONI80928.1 FAD-binding protein [Saccharothrix sp. ALI-22-I]
MLDVSALRGVFGGTVLTRDDDGFEAARVLFNIAVETSPAVIARCTTAEDVRQALAFARRSGLPAAVRSGGHSVAGASLVQDGLVLDMRAMDSVTVAADARTAAVGGGATWGAVDRATQAYSVATTGGRVSTTGVGGLTLGGGSGWLERKFGLACDNLLSVDLVLADGREVTASETEHPDLFWALHGGGGNFGVATSFTFRLHRLPEFSIALLLWPHDEGEAVTRAYRDFVADAPDEIGGGLLYLTGPPEEFMPPHLVGQLCCAVLVTHAGPEAELRELAAPLLEADPKATVLTDIPYADLQCMLDDPPGFRNYWSAEYLMDLPDEAVRRFCASAYEMVYPSPSQHALWPWGGAVARAGDWPMRHRDVPWVVHPFGVWADPADDERARRWAHRLRDALQPWSTGATYLNFIGDEGADRVVAGFGAANYARLAQVKAEYDPDNVFNRWHNIVPATVRRDTVTRSG